MRSVKLAVLFIKRCNQTTSFYAFVLNGLYAQEAGLILEQQTFMMALQACALLVEMEEDCFIDGVSSKIKSLKIGKSLHVDLVLRDFL